MYAQSTTSTGMAAADWSEPVTVLADEAWQDTYLTVVAGCPAISFCAYTGHDPLGCGLAYTRASTNTGGSASDWDSLLTLDASVENTGRNSMLAVANGCPVIAYQDSTNGGVMFISAHSASGDEYEDWDEPETLADGIHGLFLYISMTVVNGNPAISYGHGLKLMYAYYQP